MISNKAKSMSSARHVQKSINVGEDGQRRYYDSCKNAGMIIKKTGKGQDIKHIDFVVDGATVDVKGIKNSQKNGKILLEVKNVLGNNGGCSESGPEWIAFDFGAFFLNAKNTDLIKLVKKLCNLNDKVANIESSLYKGYTRKDRLDLMTTVTLKDVLNNCEHWFLPFEVYKEPMELL